MEISLTQVVFFAIDAVIKRSLMIAFVMSVVYLISELSPKIGEKYPNTKWSTKNVFQILFLFLVIQYTLHLFLGAIFYRDPTAFFSQEDRWKDSLAAIIFASSIFFIIWYVVTCRYKQPFSSLGFSKDKLKLGLIWSIRAFFVLGILLFMGSKYFRPARISSPIELNSPKILSLLIFAPVSEEIFNRGFIYPNFRRKVGIVLGIFFSSICFVATHQFWEGWLSIFLKGVILCWLYEKSGSLIPPIIGHAVLNGYSILRSYHSGILIYAIPWPLVWVVALITIMLVLMYPLSNIQTTGYAPSVTEVKFEKPSIKNSEEIIKKATRKGWTVAIILGLILSFLYFLGLFHQ